MPYAMSWKTGGVIWRFHGVVTSEDVIQSNLAIYGDSRFDNLRYQVVDLSTIEQFSVTSDALDEIAAMNRAASLSNPRLVVAVAATGEEALKLAEIYESAMSKSSWKVRVFRSVKDAEDWGDSSRSRAFASPFS